MSEIIELFSTPVYKTTIDISESDIQFSTTCRQNIKINTYGNYNTTNSFILNDPVMNDLKFKITSELQYYSDNIMGLSDDVKLQITQSWFNYNDIDSSHHTHMHGNSIISGVIYFTENPSDIVFFRDYPTNTIKLNPNLKKTTKFNSQIANLKIDKFDMILFPSSAPHGVDKNSSSNTRISLSFNTFYSGILGNAQDMTYLEIK
jgi:uncharacterized protein (TIGR02466 family)